MIRNPKISIIIPVYNAKMYIIQCILSISKQEYNNFEVILVDDGSKDGSSKICDDWAEKDHRFKVIHQTNLGVSIARNVGIDNSTGDYIVFVDADDFLLPCALKSLYDNMVQTKTQLVCGSYQMQKTRNRLKVITYQDAVYKENEFDENFVYILRDIANAPWGKLFDAQIIRKRNIRFPERVKYGEDSVFLIRYCRYIDSLSICSDILYNYNFTDSNSAMKKFYPTLYQYFYLALEEKEKFFEEREKLDLYNSIRSDEEQYYFERCLRHYILRAKYSVAKSLIASAASTLLHNDASCKYQKYVAEKDWGGLIRNWKKENWQEVFINSIKSIMNI